MKPLIALCVALLAGPLILAPIAHAEGSLEEDVVRKPVKKRVKPKAKPAAAPVTPSTPIPYKAYSTGAGSTPALSPEMAAALTPSSPEKSQFPATSALPSTLPSAPAISQPVTSQPLTAPPAAMPAPEVVRPPAFSTGQVSLKCETQVTRGSRFISQGTFYIDLFPSPVFPDENADFKFLFVDPAHQSLIRQSVCLDVGCSATVSGTAYYLVNRVTRRGSALRITLDRSNGAFYAEDIENSRLGGDSHLGEKGYCVPQKLPSVLF
ncbi:hypothetical protein AEAC466_06705 [Asticcacaulis sp. AC466]|uniref:hypothetical protein n=1 Tax=Asticcacaulis sp. AC466 TaxID=1282362 RepID=UPI0003C3BE04|nr:hypothetical protein [Asticcacaulis sp. AC466]ESQ84740.1 hypothetical protein AEAC466_06705 [Asticcacaulis sp. AC466]